ncbi:helix-turn-helix domain-containing protein [Haladaptatus sp. GCM10025707]|uniref:winged helix-turn-helix domain-containing protein n=1 Tax=unclassified Haladaptatus TaxID=2622732 RepID=UPI0023E86EE5|nr:helix-turn-helix domain-containing protein [Haladaptatus sp. QDMS2]
MKESSIQDCEECLAPADAFSTIANETRLAILEALWTAPERPVSFSELRRSVGMRDSAQFNYHLGKLTGHFVKKTDDGYDFRHAGKKVVRAVLEGSFNEDPELPSFGISGSCADCGGGLQAAYADEQITIDCTVCGRFHSRYSFPPGGLNDRTREEIMAAFNQRVRHLHCLAADGVCPECTGRMETTLRRAEDADFAGEVCVELTCAQCNHQISSAVGLKLLDQSDMVTFHRNHGIDLCATPYWEFDWCVSDNHTTIVSEDPWSIQVTIPLDDEELRVTLDGDLRVTDVETFPATAPADSRTTA